MLPPCARGASQDQIAHSPMRPTPSSVTLGSAAPVPLPAAAATTILAEQCCACRGRPELRLMGWGACVAWTNRTGPRGDAD